MLLTIARFELLRIVRSPRIFLPLFAALMGVFAAMSGASWVNFQEKAIHVLERLKVTQESQILKDAKAVPAASDTLGMGNPLHPISANWKRNYVHNSPGALAVLAIGRSDIEPFYAVFNGVEPNVLLFPEEIRNPLGLMHGRWDARFLIVFLLPLLIIALGFDLASNEKESGNGRLLASGLASLSPYYFIRAAVHILLIGGSGMVGLLSTFAYTGKLPPLLDIGFIGFLACTGFYLIFWSSLCLWVNGLEKNSGFNLAALFLAWVGLCYGAPTVLESLAQRIHNLPSRNTEAMSYRVLEATATQGRKDLLKSFRISNPELFQMAGDKPRPAQAITWYPEFIAEQAFLSKVQDSLEKKFTFAKTRQADWVARFRWICPPLAMQDAVLALAGRDSEAQRHFENAEATFIEASQHAIWPYLLQSIALTPAVIMDMPQWKDYKPTPLPPHVLNLLLPLFLPVLSLLTIGWLRLRRPA